MAYPNLIYYDKKKEKMGRMRYIHKIKIICSREKTGFDYKNNYWRGKLANF